MTTVCSLGLRLTAPGILSFSSSSESELTRRPSYDSEFNCLSHIRNQSVLVTYNMNTGCLTATSTALSKSRHLMNSASLPDSLATELPFFIGEFGA
jgi:hypothetical protein